MDINYFNYDLPENLIAQTPIENRSESKLLVMDRKTGEIKHEHFYNIISYLNKGDVLVLNDTKVIPARLFGIKEETEAHIEVLLLSEEEKDTWKCLVKPAKRVKIGTIINFGDILKAECVKVLDDGIRYFKFKYEGIFLNILSI